MTPRPAIEARRKKKKKRGHRASTSIVDLLKMTGQVDFDPKCKGVYEATKKNWETYDLDLDQINRVKQQLEQYDGGSWKRSQREEIKSQKTPSKTKRMPNITDKEDSPRVGTGDLALEDLIASFHKELRYQREMIENIKTTVSSLLVQISEETEQTQVMSNKLQSDIAAIRNDAADTLQEQKNLQRVLETLKKPKHEKELSAEKVPYKHDKLSFSVPKKKRPTKGNERK